MIFSVLLQDPIHNTYVKKISGELLLLWKFKELETLIFSDHIRDTYALCPKVLRIWILGVYGDHTYDTYVSNDWKWRIYLHMTFNLAFALMALCILDGPTWHWYSASSSREALLTRKLYTPCRRSPITEYRGNPGMTLEKPVIETGKLRTQGPSGDLVNADTLPRANPSLVHCTCPATLATSHSSMTSPPSWTLTLRGCTRKYCCWAVVMVESARITEKERML